MLKVRQQIRLLSPECSALISVLKCHRHRRSSMEYHTVPGYTYPVPLTSKILGRELLCHCACTYKCMLYEATLTGRLQCSKPYLGKYPRRFMQSSN